MKKKLMMLLIGLMTVTAVNAQYLNDNETIFAKGKWYAGLSGSGFSLTNYKAEGWRLNIQGQGGHFFADDWMVRANIGYDNASNYGSSTFYIGAGVRYFIETCGVSFGLGANYVHSYSVDDFRPQVNVGYTFFLNRHLTLEPELYFELSTKDSKEYSGGGLRIGFGYLF